MINQAQGFAFVIAWVVQYAHNFFLQKKPDDWRLFLSSFIDDFDDDLKTADKIFLLAYF